MNPIRQLKPLALLVYTCTVLDNRQQARLAVQHGAVPLVQAWVLTMVQVVEAALKSADMDVASVDFLVLHQVGRSKSPWVMPFVPVMLVSPLQHTIGSLGTAGATTIAACGARPAVKKNSAAGFSAGIWQFLTASPCRPAHSMLLGGQHCGCPSRSTGPRAVSGPPDLLSGRVVAVHLQHAGFSATGNELCYFKPPVTWF